MYPSVPLLAVAAMAAAVTAQDLTDESIPTMGNNSLFNTWRPTSHFIAPAGWMNDPCGFMYDPTRETYHLFYQWHPQHINWGDISWGHATSKDLITWTDVGGWQNESAVALAPAGGNTTYDGLGIFSGTAQPVNIHGEQDGNLTIFYTSVQYLPISWNIPYINNTETQSLATSSDGGKTWQQYEGNPVIKHHPGDWNITGFRDPYFEPWPEMDNILGMSDPHYYAVFGSGIKGVGPRMPFFSAPASDLTNWTFQGALWEPTDNSSLSSVFMSGTNGFNFEVSGFFSLADEDGNLHFYVNMGTEGGNVTFHESSHWAMFYEGTVSRRENGSAAFNPISGGPMDPGLLYAITSFNDKPNNRRLQIGWAPEDIVADGGAFSAKQQGFQGSLSLPRELFVQTTRNVANYNGTVADLGPVTYTPQADGSFVATALGVRPASDVVLGLRNGTSQQSFQGGTLNSTTTLVTNGSQHYEIMATVANATGVTGLRIAMSPDGREHTDITFDPSTFNLTVDRTSSSLITGFNNATITAYFRPFYIMPTMGDGNATMEDLNWHVFLDGSLLEIYLNDRFALTTRIYPSMNTSTGIAAIVGDGASARFSSINYWPDLYNVWPERPLNSSSPLVWDTPEETDNYTWWTGN